MRVSIGWAMSVCLATLSACAGTRSYGWDPMPPGAAEGGAEIAAAERWVAVAFHGAVLASQRPDGTPWHRSKPDNSSVVIGGLFGLALGNPSVGLALGKALATEGGDPLAPAPYVVLKVGGSSYRISAAEQTYSPHWEQPIAVDTRPLQGSDVVVVQVLDGLDDSLIGQQEYKVEELLLYGSRTLTNLGPVASLDMEVKPLPPRQRQEYDIVVPGNASLRALVEGSSQDWGAIPVWNGDAVTIRATGSVCPSSWERNKCNGPDGVPDKWLQYNCSDFRGVPHAALVAYFPGASVYVGSSQQMIAQQSGEVLLFVNDRDEANNLGSFRVHVTVDPPR